MSRLLFTEEPYFDESFIGYIMRLADLNDIPDIRWILKMLRPGKFYKYDYRYTFDFRINIAQLAEITGVDREKLSRLLYTDGNKNLSFSSGTLLFFDKSLYHAFVLREKPKICPKCLAERNYCRKIWEIALVTTCPLHKCLLLDYCPNCLQKLDWSRPKIYLCHCNFDFRKGEIFHLKEIELRLSKYLYQYFELDTGQPEFVFSYPLKTLSFSNLIKLLLFVAAYFSKYNDSDGSSFFKYTSNNLLHSELTTAIIVFENWAENYYIFVRDWHKRKLNFYTKRKALDLWDGEGFIETYDYETFNCVLYTYFHGKQFAFLRRGFESFIEKFLAGDFLIEPFLWDYFD